MRSTDSRGGSTRSRTVLGAALVALALAACTSPSTDAAPGTPSTHGTPSADAASPDPTAGSSAPRPDSDGKGIALQPRPADLVPIERLAPGQRPPQFVVVSFDGACRSDLFQHYLDLGAATGSRFTFFLSGLCLVPTSQRMLYHPPRHPVGSSAIGFALASRVEPRIALMATAYRQGYEIGTHFLGHFCDAQGVGAWSSAEWQSEIDQARYFLDQWAEVNHVRGTPPVTLPFDSHSWTGDRTPCLGGIRHAMWPVFAKAGFRYDASGAGSLSWPTHVPGTRMWNFPLQRIPVVGFHKSALSMDFNFLAQQNGERQTAPVAQCDRIRTSTTQSYLHALDAVETHNRAPLFIGNHFNSWVCNAYTDAITTFVQQAHARYPDVRFVTFDYLARWLDAQDPKMLAAWRAKGIAPA